LPETNKHEGSLFPAPLSVETTTNAIPPYIYFVQWDYVSGASDYQLYAKNTRNNQIAKIDTFKFDGRNYVGIYYDDFKKLTVFGTGPYQIGIIAVSPSGLYSDTTWSNTFDNID